MAHRLQLRGRDGNMAWDFTDATGLTNPHGLKCTPLSNLDFGFASGDPQFFEPMGRAGGSLLRRRDRLIESLLHLNVVADGAESLHMGVSELDRLLRLGGTLEWQPDGASARLADVETGWTEGLLRGQDATMLYLNKGDFYPLPVVIVRQPHWRGTVPVSSGTNLLKNPTLLRDSNLDGEPDSWAWLDASNISAHSIQGEESHFTIATAAARSLQQQTAAAVFAAGDVATFSFYVRAAVAEVVRARAAVQFYKADGVTQVGSEQVGSLTSIGTHRKRLSVTTVPAGADASRATVSLRFENAAATATETMVGKAQLELGDAPTEFVTSNITLVNNPGGFPVAMDVFGRVLANSWGAPTFGGNWLINQGAAADFDVNQAGTIASTAANQEHRVSIASAVEDIDLTVRFSTDKVAAGANQEVYVLARQTAPTTYYRVVVELRTGNSMWMRLDKVVAGVVTNLVPAVNTGETVVASTSYIVRFSIQGPRLRAKLWLHDIEPPGVQEPGWDVDVTDTSIKGTGGIGLGTIFPTGSSNAPVVHSFDDFNAHSQAGSNWAFIHIGGTAPAPVHFGLKAGAGTKMVAARIAVRASEDGARELPGLVNAARVFQLEEAQLLSNATQDFDQGASNGRMAVISSDTDAEPIRRLRYETTEHLDSLKGTFDVVLRVKNTAPDVIGSTPPLRADFRLAWAPSLINPAAFTKEKIPHDAAYSGDEPVVTGAWVELPMGRIHIPEDSTLSGLCFEVLKSGIADCSLDYLALVPVDQLSIVGLPYVSRRSLSKADAVIDVAGEFDTHSLGVLPAGRYRISWYYSAENTTDEVVLFKIRAGAAVVVEGQDLTRTGDRTQAPFALEFDADGVSSYNIYVEWDRDGDTGTIYTIHERWIDQLPYVSAGESLVTDPEEYRIEKRGVDDAMIVEAGLRVGGTPFVLEPGLYAVNASFFQPRHEGWYRESKSVALDSAELDHWYVPRYQ